MVKNMGQGWKRATSQQKGIFIAFGIVGIFILMFVYSVIANNSKKSPSNSGKATSTFASASSKITDQTTVTVTDELAAKHKQKLLLDQDAAEQKNQTFVAPPTIYNVTSTDDINEYEKLVRRVPSKKSNVDVDADGSNEQVFTEETIIIEIEELPLETEKVEYSNQLSPVVSSQSNNEDLDSSLLSEREAQAIEARVQQKMAFYQSLKNYIDQPASAQILTVAKEEGEKDNQSVPEKSKEKHRITLNGRAEPQNKSDDIDTDKINDLNTGDVLIAKLMSDIDSDKPTVATFEIIQGKLRGAKIDAKFAVVNNRYLAIATSSLSFKRRTMALDAIIVDPSSRGVDIPGQKVKKHYLSRWLAGGMAFIIKGLGEAISKTGTTSTSDTSVIQSTRFNSTELLIQAGGNLVTQFEDPLMAIAQREITIQLPRGTRVGVRILKPANADWLPPLKKNRDYM